MTPFPQIRLTFASEGNRCLHWIRRSGNSGGLRFPNRVLRISSLSFPSMILIPMALNPFNREDDILGQGVIRFRIQGKDEDLLLVEGLLSFVRDGDPNGGTSCRKGEDFLADHFLSRKRLHVWLQTEFASNSCRKISFEIKDPIPAVSPSAVPFSEQSTSKGSMRPRGSPKGPSPLKIGR